jgi:hypothetical protein
MCCQCPPEQPARSAERAHLPLSRAFDLAESQLLSDAAVSRASWTSLNERRRPRGSRWPVGVLAASGLGSGSSLMCRRLAFVMMRSVKQSVGGGAVRLLWAVHVFVRVVGSVRFMLELLGTRWVCAV